MLVLDAAGKPGPGLSEIRFNFVGDYHLCRSLVAPPGKGGNRFKGSYCTLKVGARPLPIFDLQWGVCLPDSCSETEITGFVTEALQLLLGDNTTIHADAAEIHSDRREARFATRLAIVCLIVIALVMLAGTLYDVLYIQRPVWQAQCALENSSQAIGGARCIGTTVDVTTIDGDDPLLEKQGKPRVPTGKLERMILAFSVYTNGQKLLSTDQSSESISCVHGIRFISMLWVILGHVHVYGFPNTQNTLSEYRALFGLWTFRVVSNAFVSVDTFFLLSGLLTTYVTVGHFKRTGRWLKWRCIYLHRYLRLTPPYALVILTITGLYKYCGQGPLWPDQGTPDIINCENHWWTNLLYINNLVHNSFDQMCLPHTWFLANDMQFFLFSPLLLITLCCHKRFGVILCCTVIVVSAVITGILSGMRQWPATILDQASPGAPTWFKDYYIAPWSRVGPFVIGILIGFYLVEDPRRKINMTKTMAVVGWTLATMTALASLYGLHGDLFSTHVNTSPSAAALYNAVARDAWAGSVAWVILACVSGWGGFVNTFLSWSPFVFLGRLTFMAYLIHPVLLLIYYNGRQTLFYLDTLTISVVYMGTVIATYAVSFILMLGFEAPVIRLERVFMPQKKD